MNLPSIAELEELYPGLSSLINAKKTTKTKTNHPIQELQRALRPWIIKESLYNTKSDLFVDVEELAYGKTNLASGCFGLAHWKKAFFAKFPLEAKYNIEQLILLDVSSEKRNNWQTQIENKYSLDDSIVRDLIHYPVFQVSSKTLNNDFQRLSQLQSPYLAAMGYRQGYKKVDLSTRGEKKQTNYINPDLSNILNAELYGIAEQLTGNIKGVQRFFIHTEYIVKGERQDSVGEAIANLKNIWDRDTVPFIKITYDSASLYKQSTRIVYPICVRYFKRALYLAAYGEDPKKRKQLAYKNYRLDRIMAIEVVARDAPEVPAKLKQELFLSPAKYHPVYIIESSARALGSDFYRPIATMLLRFPKYYHEAYIEDTLRHETFKQIDPQISLRKLFKQLKIDPESKKAIEQKMARFADDAYYKLDYRVGDNDVIMRLRAWGANVEVLYPPDLRDRMIEDITNTYKIYQ